MESKSIKVYLLTHEYEIEDDDLAVKELGIYSTKSKAKEAIERYAVLDGFKKYPRSCFKIDEQLLDVDHNWTEGFLTWEEMYNYSKENGICQGDDYRKSIFEDE